MKVPKNIEEKYALNEFCGFANLDLKSGLNILIDLEIFGLLDYYKFDNYFNEDDLYKNKDMLFIKCIDGVLKVTEWEYIKLK